MSSDREGCEASGSAAVGRVCPWWFAYSFDNPLRRIFHDPEALLGNLVRKGQTVLDLGCGMGHFSLGMARLVGPNGTVIAADLQQEMLSRVMKRARKAGLQDQVRVHRTGAGRIGLEAGVDFVLTFWMVHEVPDQGRLLQELHSGLNPGGMLLICEPKFHVSAEAFRGTEEFARLAGFKPLAAPPVTLSYSALFARD